MNCERNDECHHFVLFVYMNKIESEVKHYRTKTLDYNDIKVYNKCKFSNLKRGV